MTNAELIENLKQNRSLWIVLNAGHLMGPANWFVGAGAVCQTIWNIKHGNDAERFIKDFDFVYFDSSDLSPHTERTIQSKLQKILDDRTVSIDVTNEARVHQWYHEEFGYEIEPYQSLEDAIDSWPTTASAIGVRSNAADGPFEVYAPFGLADIDAMIVRPNKKLISKDIYESKANRWKQLWPRLSVIEW